MTRPIGSRRLFEWVMALALTGFGVHLMIFPGSLAQSRFANILTTTSAETMMFAAFTVGGVRLAALALTGLSPPWCFRIRAILGILSGAIWLQIAVALALNQASAPSPGISIYIALVIGEALSAWRVGMDSNGCSRA